MIKKFISYASKFVESKEPASELEQSTLTLINNVLSLKHTLISMDIISQKYIISNEDAHVQIDIIGASSVIKITNSIGPIGEKHRIKFVEDIQKIVQRHVYDGMDSQMQDTDTKILSFIDNLNQSIVTNHMQSN